MTLNKQLITLAAAAALAGPASAQTAMPSSGYVMQQSGIIAILIGLLLPAVQKVRD